MRVAIVATVVLLVLYAGVRFFFDTTMATSIQHQNAELQMEGTNEAFVLSQTIVNANNIRSAMTFVLFALLGVVWVPVLSSRREKRKNGVFSLTLPMMVLVLLVSAGCQTGHVEQIGSNETAFLIPVTGATSDQVTTRSIEFYQQNQVFARDVVINKYCAQTGGVFNCSWRDEFILIRVDRTPVSSQWTADPTTGTAVTDQSIRVETSESIGLYVGAVVSAQIQEEDAAAFLYYYPAPAGNSARSLNEILDMDIRLYVSGQMFDQFKARSLDEAILEASDVFTAVFESTRDYFKPRGITINFLNGSEGLVYDNPRIQDQIDQRFVADRQLELSQATATGQAIENLRLIAQANAQATATVIAGQAQAAVMQQQSEVLANNPALVQYLIAQSWNGQLPVYMGADGLPFIMMENQVQPQPTATQPANGE